ncbi:MAG: DUF4358 domain-containing protein [Clostridia bacterium]|nr:DUF4358 domain-containing protein [Clostridia bacterium]
MKRMLLILLCAVLLCACSERPKVPIIEPDMRAQTPVPTEESVQIEVAPSKETPAPVRTVEPAAEPTEEPAQTAASYADRVTAAWTAEGLLDGMAPYSEEDMLDLYGIDLSACISGVGFAETAGYTQEIVLVEADETTAGEIYQLLSDHLYMMKEQFRSYDADAYALVEKAVLINEHGAVLMIVSPDAETIARVAADVDR